MKFQKVDNPARIFSSLSGSGTEKEVISLKSAIRFINTLIVGADDY